MRNPEVVVATPTSGPPVVDNILLPETHKPDNTVIRQWWRPSRLNPLGDGLLIGFAILACYYGLWNAYFTSDDFWFLGQFRHQTDFGGAVWTEFGFGLRFLLDAIIWLRVRAFDLDASAYYWMSLFQHLVVALIVYGLVTFWSKRRRVALLTALFFGTSFAAFEVVTWITGSNYSLTAIPYLLCLALFGIYLQRRAGIWYFGTIATFLGALSLTEVALSLPLLLLTYQVTLGRRIDSFPYVRLSDLRRHVPFWAILAVFVVTELLFIRFGRSEAALAQQPYGPGPHVIANLYWLVFLVVPAYAPAILAEHLGPAGAQALLVALAVAGNLLVVSGFWKGSNLVRFALALVYVPFLPFTLWNGNFAGAIRYRYLPAIGFSLLLALFFAWLSDAMTRRGLSYWRFAVPSVVAIVLVANIILVQVWVQRHLQNSVLRRAFVTQLAARYSDVARDTRIEIEVPADKYADLAYSCRLVIRHSVACATFVGYDFPFAVATGSLDPHLIVLRATSDGLRQIYPASE